MTSRPDRRRAVLAVLATLLVAAGATGCRAKAPRYVAPPEIAPVAPSISLPERSTVLDLYYLPFDVSPAHIDELAQRAWITGADSVYVTVTERDLADDRKLVAAIDSIHRRGMDVILDPYIGGTFSGDEGESAAGYLADHPEDRSVAADGTLGDVPTVASPGYRTRMEAVLQGLLAYPVTPSCSTSRSTRRPRGASSRPTRGPEPSSWPASATRCRPPGPPR